MNTITASLGRLIKYTRKYTKRLLESILFYLLGTCVALGMILFVIVTIPAIVLRVTVNYVMLPCYLRQRYGYTKLVPTGFGTAYAVEYISSLEHSRASRNVMLVSNVVQGHMPFEDCSERVENGLANVKKFPEFRQYVESWYGYMFWKQDDKFDIHNHLTCHKLSNDADLDQACSNLFEELGNKKFVPKRSPWEIHVLHGMIKGEKRTVFITRVHHVFGDGLSVTSVGIEGLFGVRLEDCYTKSSSPVTSSPVAAGKKKCKNFVAVILLRIQLIIGLLYDIGCVASFMLWRASIRTPLHAPDDKKMWKQLYAKSELIPIEKVKHIKNKMGVSFNAVLTSSMAASIAHAIKNKSGEENITNFLSASPKFLADRPMEQLTTHITGTAYKIPVQFKMDPIERLLECDKIIKRVNPSLFNTIFPFLTHFLSFHIPPIAQLGFRNAMFGSSLSNFPGPDKEINVENGKKLVELSAAVGGFDGIAGIMLVVYSYANHFRFSLMVESGVLNRDQLAQFVKRMEEEIDVLHEVTLLQNERKLAELQQRGNNNLNIEVEN